MQWISFYTYFINHSPNIYAFFLLSGIGVVLTILPYLLNNSIEPNLKANEGTSYEESKYSFTFAIGVAFPILLEALIDRKLPHTITLPRWAHIISLIIPNLILFFTYNQKLRLCAGFMRELLFRGSFMSHMFNENERFRPLQRWAYFIIMILFCIHSYLTMWFGYGDDIWDTILKLFAVVIGICCVMLLYIAYQVNQSQGEKSDTHASIYTVLIVASILLKGILKTFVYSSTFPPPQYIAIVTTWDASLSMLAATFPSRVARKDRDLSQYLLNTKKKFIRFLSKEYRLSLKTIISSVKLTISSVQSLSDLPSMAAVLSLLTDVRYSCDHACSLLDNVMLVDEIKDRSLSLSCTEHSVFAILHEAVEPLKQAAMHARVHLQHDLPMHIDPNLEGVMINVDKSQFIQALRNLIHHSIKVTPCGQDVKIFCFALRDRASQRHLSRSSKVYAISKEGYEYGSFMIEDKKNINSVCIEVHDNGPGVPQEMRDDLFKESMIESYLPQSITADAEIGLYVSQGIIKLHGGKIGVYSEENQGCVFSVEMQVSSVLDVEELETREITEPKNSNGGTLPDSFHSERTSCEVKTSHHQWTHQEDFSNVSLKRALIVSSNSRDVVLLREVLEPCTAEVVHKNNYADAMVAIDNSLYELQTFNIVIMDSSMAGENVSNMVSKFRKKGYSGIAVLISDEHFPDTNEKFLLRGGEYVLLRPLISSDLERVLIASYRLMLKSSLYFLAEQGMKSLNISQPEERNI